MYVIVVSNSNREVVVCGTPTGRLYRSEQAANGAAKRYGEDHPHLFVLVAPLEGLPVGV